MKHMLDKGRKFVYNIRMKNLKNSNLLLNRSELLVIALWLCTGLMICSAILTLKEILS